MSVGIAERMSARRAPHGEQALMVLRVVFSVFWFVSAWFQLHLTMGGGLANAIAGAAKGQPAWLAAYFLGASHLVAGLGSHFVGALMTAISTALGVGLLLGQRLRIVCWVGVLFSMVIWATFGGLGGPYTTGFTDPGNGILYALAFFFILAFEADQRGAASSGKATAARLIFAAIWVVDAVAKWHPYFLTHSLSYLRESQQGQPAWIVSYIQVYLNALALIGPLVFGLLVALFESLIALSLIMRRGLAVMLPLAAVFTFLLWTTGEGFGGPYGPGFTSGDPLLGTGLLYTYLFLYLMVFHPPVRERKAGGVSSLLRSAP